VIFDPPRAGLHDAVTSRVLEVLPPQVVYLSCNPATQARDVARLQEAYDITYFEGFNFFPHTPHIETLVVLTRK
jgi:23S rRNA (uracil1939-C5)-methyltransferase